MATIDEVGQQDSWRCWLCDEPVDAELSVNDDRGPSVDSRISKKKAKKKSKRELGARLAHRSCNTGKGNVEAAVPWPDELFVVDPVPIIPAAERLMTKGGRQIMGRCLSGEDAEAAMIWIVDRLSRLEPSLKVTPEIQDGGGQFLVVLQA